MRQIPLTKGAVALVDDADFDWLNQWKWCTGGGGYATRGVRREGKQFAVRMHRELLGLPQVYDGRDGDHINRDRLDNRRENLRISTRSQNLRNRRVATSSVSGVRGVHWDARCGLWCARLTVHAGRYETRAEAEAAVKEATGDIQAYVDRFAETHPQGFGWRKSR